jgi:hypothetical protein
LSSGKASWVMAVPGAGGNILMAGGNIPVAGGNIPVAGGKVSIMVSTAGPIMAVTARHSTIVRIIFMVFSSWLSSALAAD